MPAIGFREYKLLLKAERFADAAAFDTFRRAVKQVAKSCDVKLDADGINMHPAARKVRFYDTADSVLFKNSFILRKRIRTVDGLRSEQELTFKFRNKDAAKAASTDIRSTSNGKVKIKFKDEILPPSDGSVGFRSVYSHNCIEKGPDLPVPERFADLAARFPTLAALEAPGDAAVSIVNDMRVDESEVELGELDFGAGYKGEASAAVWNSAADDRALIGEFSFQTTFADASRVDPKAQDRALHFYNKMQNDLRDWISAGTTKTSLIYGPAVARE